MAPQQPYFPNDPLFIFFPNGGIEASQMFVWDGSKPILWDGKVTFSGSITIGSITGDKTNNNAPPGADNLGVLPALANAAHPTYAEGNLVLLSTDLQGNLRTIFSGSLPAGTALVGKVGIDQTTPGTTNGVVNNAAVANSGDLPIIGAVKAPKVTQSSSNGTPITSATTTDVVAAPSSGHHLEVYRIQASNSSATVVTVGWKESGGSQRYEVTLPQYGIVSLDLKGSWKISSATKLQLVTSAAGSILWEADTRTEVD